MSAGKQVNHTRIHPTNRSRPLPRMRPPHTHPRAPRRLPSKQKEPRMSDDNDEMQEFVRHLFSTADSPPRDVVPGSGPTRGDYLRWNDMADTIVEVSVPGEV